MTAALIVAALLAAIVVSVIFWLILSDGTTSRRVEFEREWAEMQIEQLGREARARMRQAADEVRSQQRPGGP